MYEESFMRSIAPLQAEGPPAQVDERPFGWIGQAFSAAATWLAYELSSHRAMTTQSDVRTIAYQDIPGLLITM